MDYAAPAEVFTAQGNFSTPLAMGYRRFVSGGLAVKFVIEKQARILLNNTAVQSGDMRFSGAEIRELYDSTDFPLARGR